MENSARSKTVFPFYLLKTACIHGMQFEGLGVPNKYFTTMVLVLKSSQPVSDTDAQTYAKIEMC